jgi:hypothetical protein
MLLRYRRSPLPPVRLDLDEAAAVLARFDISGRTLAEIFLRAPDPLVFGLGPGDALPQPLGAGRTRRLWLQPGNVIETDDGVLYREAVVLWRETRAALLAAGCRGVDRLPGKPGLFSTHDRVELPLNTAEAGQWWWRNASAEISVAGELSAPAPIEIQPGVPTVVEEPPAAIDFFPEFDAALIVMAQSGVRPGKTQTWKRTSRQAGMLSGTDRSERTVKRHWADLKLPR